MADRHFFGSHKTQEELVEAASTVKQADFVAQLIDKLAEAARASALTPEALELILARAGAATAEGMRQTLKPENQDHPHISAYFTEKDRLKYGEWTNKPVLKRKTLFCGIEEKDDRLTPTEIEGYNSLTGYRESRGGKWKAEVIREGKRNEELHVTVPFESIDQRMDLPPLVLILHELNGGVSTEHVEDLVHQLERLKAMVLNTTSLTPQELDAQLQA